MILMSKSIINPNSNENIFLLKQISINAINHELFKASNYIYFSRTHIDTIKNIDKYKK